MVPRVNIEPLVLPEVLLIKRRVFPDDRGQFLEMWRASESLELGLPPFVQDNVSISRRGVLRGLHFQHPHAQGKLVLVLRGRAFDVVVDIRRGSPRFGHWASAELSGDSGHQLYVPPGFAHGFMALTDDLVFVYKCTDYYTPACERTICWNDPDVGVAWPAMTPVIAPKDSSAPRLAELPPDCLPRYDTTSV
jgi:dTDP-4-dehydrorhamnose 3,5-epimerase